MEFKPPFIDVTYHREEYTVYKELENGLLLKKQVVKKTTRNGWYLRSTFKINMVSMPVPHILCGGFTKEDTENFFN